MKKNLMIFKKSKEREQGVRKRKCTHNYELGAMGCIGQLNMSSFMDSLTVERGIDKAVKSIPLPELTNYSTRAVRIWLKCTPNTPIMFLTR